MRWLLVLVAVVCLGGAWWARSALWFGLGLAVGVIAAIAAALAFAQARIEGSSQAEVLTDPEIEALKAAVRRQTPSETGNSADGISFIDSGERREGHDT